MAAANTAILAGDYGTALEQAICAQGLIATTPETETGGRDGQRLAFSSNQITEFIGNIRKIRASRRGIRRTKVNYVNPSS